MKNGNPLLYIFFVGALLTAGMTAFYMFRMVILTFFGTPRDHHKFDHAHESPLNMTIPLIILATLSFAIWFEPWFGKLVVKPKTVANVAMVSAAQAPAHEAAPATAAGHEAAPVMEGHAAAPAEHAAAPAAHGATHDAAHDAHIEHVAHLTAMYSSVGIGTLGIVLAFGIYLLGWVDPKAVAERFKPLYLFSLNKWYFDELYEATVINGSKAFSRGCAWFDNNVVDGLVNLSAQVGVFLAMLIGKFDNAVVDGAVNGVADVTIGSGSVLRRVQTGKLFHYLFILAGGALIIFLVKFF